METENKKPNLTSPEEENPYEMYGWEFHKKPLIYAVIMTVLFYSFIIFYSFLG